MIALHKLLTRLAFGFVVLLGVTTTTFFISHVLPGDPALLLAGEGASPEVVQHIRAELGLNDPMPQQYVRYLASLARGDLGRSVITGQPVLNDIAAHFPATAELAVAAVCLALLLAMPLGLLGGLTRRTWLNRIIGASATLMSASPAFWIGLLLITVFYSDLGILPGSGRSTLSPLDHGSLRSSLLHLIMPATSLAIPLTGQYIRTLRVALLRIRDEDYVRMARAFGVTRWRIGVHYYLRNAVFALITVLGLSLAGLMTGAVVVESVFGWPGVGLYMLQAINNLDTPAIMGVTVVICLVYFILNSVIDVSQDLLDAPRRQGH